jgi:hypothetical protein
LYEGGRRKIVHILGEAVLHTRVGKVTAETMAGQLAHLAETATMPGHELGIVPFAIPSPVAPASGFVLYDTDLAVVETLGGRLQITEPDMIGRYTRWLELLRQAAITGDEAADMCRRAAAELPLGRLSAAGVSFEKRKRPRLRCCAYPADDTFSRLGIALVLA